MSGIKLLRPTCIGFCRRLFATLLATALLAHAQSSLASTQTPKQVSLPTWAEAQWTSFSSSHTLVRATSAAMLVPVVLSGDFDGDGRVDVAILVDHAKLHKRGIVILHREKTPPKLIGAGVDFGNGGDDFTWMDHWAVVEPSPQTSTSGVKARGVESRRASLLVERQESGGGIIGLVQGRYRWRQYGN